MNQRKPRNRLNGFDYTSFNSYFITICTYNKDQFLSFINNKKSILTEIGKLVQQQWLWLGANYNYIQLHEYIIMPDHIHGILQINNTLTDRSRPVPTHFKSLSSLIGAFKTTSSKIIRKQMKIDFRWQRSFHDRIIRNSCEYNEIKKYITENPVNWNSSK